MPHTWDLMISIDEDFYIRKKFLRLNLVSVLPLLLLAIFFFRGQAFSHFSSNTHTLLTNAAQLLAPENGDEQVKKTISSLDTKWAKYRKKYKHLNDSSSDLQPFQKRVEARLNFIFSPYLGYESPFFRLEQHSFLHRLAYF